MPRTAASSTCTTIWQEPLLSSFLREGLATVSTPSTKTVVNSPSFKKLWKLWCELLLISTRFSVSIWPYERPMASRMFFILPYLESWRKLKPVWLRRFLANAVNYLPWPSARKVSLPLDFFKGSISTSCLFESSNGELTPCIPSMRICLSRRRRCWKKAEYLSSKERHQAVKTFQPSSVRLAFDDTPTGFNVFPFSVSANQLADEEDRMPDDVVISNMRFAWCPWDIKLFWTLLQLHCPRRTRNDFRRSFSAPVFDSQRQWHTKASAQRIPRRWCCKLYQVCFQDKLYWPASSYRPSATKGSITVN